jgi:putative flippase GtrA
LKRFVKYIGIGLVATGIEWSIFWFLKINLAYQLSFFIAFIFANFFHYLMTTKFVFTESKFSRRREFTYVLIISTVGFFINLTALTIFVEYFDLSEMTGKMLASGTAIGWNYFMRKYFVFKQVEDEHPEAGVTEFIEKF